MHKSIQLSCLLCLFISGCNIQDPSSQTTQPKSDKWWQACPAGQSLENQICQGRPITMAWHEALGYCASLSGKKTWRLPDRNELLNFYHWPESRNALSFVNLYWSSTTNEDNPQMAWYLVPGLDWLYFNLKELDGLVLCVADT